MTDANGVVRLLTRLVTQYLKEMTVEGTNQASRSRFVLNDGYDSFLVTVERL